MLNFVEKYFPIHKELDSSKNIEQSIRQGIEFKGTNLITLVCAIFIASLGLNINSTSVVIGAMLISPLMGPIIGIGYGASTYKLEIIKNSFKNYSFATIISIITSTIYFLVSPINDAQSELLSRTSPNIYDVIIALFGGFSAITAMTIKNKGNILSGVAIATALMPPLCTAGYGIATNQIAYTFGAFYLFFINTVFIILSSYLYLKIINFQKEINTESSHFKKTNKIIFWVATITLLPSIYLGYDLIKKNKFKTNANKYISSEFKFSKSLVLQKIILPNKNNIQIYIGGEKIDSTLLSQIIFNKKNYGLDKANIEINQVATFENYRRDKNRDENIEITKSLNLYLSNYIDSVRKIDFSYLTIANEIKFITPGIDTCYFVKYFSYEQNSFNKTITIIVESTKGTQKIDSTKLIEWLKVRLPTDSFVIKIIK
ncbi:MAG: DUF389 domain-containing protein [Chitinophagaceae bacterium]